MPLTQEQRDKIVAAAIKDARGGRSLLRRDLPNQTEEAVTAASESTPETDIGEKSGTLISSESENVEDL